MKLSNNKSVKLSESIINNINKAIDQCDQKIGKEPGSKEWNKAEEEIIMLYLEIGRNIVLDNFLPY